MTTAAVPSWPASPHEATRFILGHLPGSEAVEGGTTEIERTGRLDDPPSLVEANLLEGSRFESITVTETGEEHRASGFTAFLDGTQELRIVSQSVGAPIVWATVASAIRIRVNRRLVAWHGHAPIVSRRFYVPVRYVGGLNGEFLRDPRVVDTAVPNSAGAVPSRHPAALMEAAVKRVQQDREAVERTLAEAWCASETGVLYVDGSIAASAVTSASLVAVGVVKSHRRLYAGGDAFDTVFALEPGHRTSVFEVRSGSRNTVASWYVRTRRNRGMGALFGLVRVEAAMTRDIADRANEISRWVIAEGAPLALPDGRWDRMAYGIRDTEQFLRAIS